MPAALLLAVLTGCADPSSNDALLDVERPRFSYSQTAPDGTVLEETVRNAGGLAFEGNDRSAAPFISNPSREHGEAPVSDAECVTATTLHGPTGYSLTFGPDGAVLAPNHLFRFIAAVDGVGYDYQYLYGGRIEVLEQSEDTLSIEIVDALWCDDSPDAGCVPQPQPNPYRLSIEGTFVVSPGDSEVRATDRFVDPVSGTPLCEAFQAAYDEHRD